MIDESRQAFVCSIIRRPRRSVQCELKEQCVAQLVSTSSCCSFVRSLVSCLNHFLSLSPFTNKYYFACIRPCVYMRTCSTRERFLTLPIFHARRNIYFSHQSVIIYPSRELLFSFVSLSLSLFFSSCCHIWIRNYFCVQNHSSAERFLSKSRTIIINIITNLYGRH